MEEKVKLSPFELSVLTILFTAGTTFLVIPSSMTAESEQDAWLSALIGMAICTGLAYFFIVCGRAMGDKNYIQYLEDVYGKILGKIMGILYVFFSFIGTATLLSYFGFFTTTQMLPNTPIEIMHILLALLVIFVVRAGLEVLARTGEQLIIWVILLLLTLIIFLMPEFKHEHLTPLYEASAMNHLKAALNFVATAGFPLVLFLMIYPKHINRPDHAKWNFITGTIIGTGAVTIIIILCILVLGPSTTARQLYPSYVLAKTVSIFDIIERIESIIGGIWVITIFFKTAIYFYACAVGFAQVLEVKTYRFLVIPMGVLAALYATVVYPNIEYMIHWDSSYWISYTAIMGFVLPLITLIVDKMKKAIKSKKATANSSNTS
ncbi:spore gernimation protein [Ureibacillus massiliensis 4400831 = CIP 108448 = CCUG 49529]|uniref:Spore gernimation protein n=1 Tax=Ureibacillus massiliensis 4400831 = CIP 108448 = CCUG 49529 TaxID=1211035 RepID=A0A0A3J341_9BACL|nr:endospore germination permease [Ureibacillus massiliensis]KGR91316.1 spore gernimation protein [Ureibacillus massiliensis 4400831 = CIP 108448 = CCUG 49529]